MQIMQRERKNEIEYIIIDLEREIESVIHKIHDRKDEMNTLTREQQEANIKRIFMERTMNEHAKKMTEHKAKLDERNQNMFADKQQAEAGLIQIQSEEIIGTHAANNAAITIQRRFRGRKENNIIFKQVQAKQQIVKNWRRFKHIKVFLNECLSINLLKAQKEAEAEHKIKEQEEREQEEKKKSERSGEHSNQENDQENPALFIHEIEENENEALPDREVSKSRKQSMDGDKLDPDVSHESKSTQRNQKGKRLTFAPPSEDEDENKDDDEIEKQSRGGK